MSKISELSDGGALQSTDYLIAVRSGGNVKVQLSELPSGIGAGGNIVFGDNEKAIFGAGSDLQIYHDGSASYIADTGTGTLNIKASGSIRLRGNDTDDLLARFNENGSNQFYYDNSEKLATTATGIDVTGTVTADGADLDGAVVINESGADVDFRVESDTNTAALFLQGSDGKFGIGTGSPEATLTVRGLPVSENGSTSYGSTLIRGEDYSISNTQRGILDIEMSSITAQDRGATLTFTNNVSQFGQGLDYVAAGLKAGKENTVNTNQSAYLAFYTNDAGTVSERLRISSGGDISFYEDTGTTAKFFWDASAEKLEIDSSAANPLLLERNGGTDANVSIQFNCATSDWYVGTNPANNFAIGTDIDQTNSPFQIDSSGNVGIGTSSPAAELEVVGTGDANGAVLIVDDAGSLGVEIQSTSPTIFFNEDDTTDQNYQIRLSSGALNFQTQNDSRNAASTKMTLDVSGNVGIGTSSPTGRLHLQSSSAFVTQKFASSVGDAANITAYRQNPASLALYLACNRDSSTGVFADTSAAASNIGLFGESNNGYIRFSTSSVNNTTPTERMRIDSSGNAMFNTTNVDPAGNNVFGTAILQYGGASMSRNNTPAILLNRSSSDGEIARFSKDGTTVGSIGSNAGQRLTLGNADVGLIFQTDSTDYIGPYSMTAAGGRDNAINLGFSTNRFKDLYLSGGVYLGGTGAANLLDDYETGTWTPVVNDAASGGNTATGTFSGRYVKVGKLVTVQCSLVNISTTGMTAGNILHIQGFPFFSSSSTNATTQPRVENVAYVDSIAVLLGDSRTFAYLRSNTQGSSSTNVNVSDVTSGTGDIIFTLSYETA